MREGLVNIVLVAGLFASSILIGNGCRQLNETLHYTPKTLQESNELDKIIKEHREQSINDSYNLFQRYPLK